MKVGLKVFESLMSEHLEDHLESQFNRWAGIMELNHPSFRVTSQTITTARRVGHGESDRVVLSVLYSVD